MTKKKKEVMIIEYLPWEGMYRALNSFIFRDRQYRPGELISKVEIAAYLKGDIDP